MKAMSSGPVVSGLNSFGFTGLIQYGSPLIHQDMKEVMDRQAEEELGASKHGKTWKTHGDVT